MTLRKKSDSPGKFAASVKMGEKGQIVIPKEVRDLMGFAPGDTLLLLCDKKRGVAIPPTEQAQKIYRQIFGTLDGLGEEDEEP